jgi:hypothetical protein
MGVLPEGNSDQKPALPILQRSIPIALRISANGKGPQGLKAGLFETVHGTNKFVP